MKIIFLTDGYQEPYQKFILKFESALFYYSVKYKQLLEALLDCKSEYLLAVEADQIKGVLPLMKMSGKFGIIYNSLPFYGSHGGIISESDEAASLLMAEYNRLITAPGVSAATLIENPLTDNNGISQLSFDVIDRRIGQWTALNVENMQALESLFDSSARRNIRKAEKSGVLVKIDNSREGLDFLRETHQKNMQSIGGKAKTEKFFDLIPDCFESGKDYNIYVAYLDKKPVAALLLFYFNGVVEYFTPTVIEEMRSYQPLALIIYRAMQDAMSQHYKWWNWGGTWLVQDGVYKFKKKWAAVDKPYKYYTKINEPFLVEVTKETLLAEYDNFFVLPFSLIKTEGN